MQYGKCHQRKNSENSILDWRNNGWISCNSHDFPYNEVLHFGPDKVEITPAYRYSLGMGAALMLGWAVLLLWGSVKPVERKGLLIITVFPVITAIVMAQIYAVSAGLVELSGMIPVWIHLIFISSLFLYAYFTSKIKNNK